MARPRIDSLIKLPPAFDQYPALKVTAEALVRDYAMGSGSSHPEVLKRWIKMERQTLRALSQAIIYARRSLSDDENAIIAWVGSHGFTRD